MEPIEIRSETLTATIAPLGAELRSLADGEGRNLLWSGDPAVWSGRAPILFPIVGALAGDSYRLDGACYSLPRHGFGRRSTFSPVVRKEAEAIFRLTDSPPTRAAYPFPFVLEIRFAIAGAMLAIDATLANPGDAPLPASFGFHPALRWPLPYGGARHEHVLLFDRPETGSVRRLDTAGLMLPEPVASPIAGRTLQLEDALFAQDAIILERPASRSLWYGVPGKLGIRIDHAGMPSLGLWTKPGAGYLCIEPWQGHADPRGFEGDFRDKPGMLLIQPGQSHSFGMAITVGVDAPQ